MVFFVLSGYVIAFVADTKEALLSEFALSRSVRILSVTVPALLLTLLASIITDQDWRAKLFQIPLNAAFLGESWSINIAPEDNPAYWSLCYEVWYYSIFAGFVFPKTGAGKIFWGSAMAVLAGPKILLLMPVWLMGVGLYKYRLLLRVPPTAAWALILGSVAAYGIFFWFDISIAIREHIRLFAPRFVTYLTASNQFVGDNLLGVIVSSNFAAIASLAYRSKASPKPILALMNAIAGFTLSLYLYHFPVIIIAQHFGIVGGSGLLLVILIPVGLGYITELQRFRLREYLRRLFRLKVSRTRIANALHEPLPAKITH